jgi:hypothetical protein
MLLKKRCKQSKNFVQNSGGDAFELSGIAGAKVYWARLIAANNAGGSCSRA